MTPVQITLRRARHAGVVRNWLKRDEGVTLLEVLVVIMIMGFIATLGSLQLTKYFSRARVDTAKLQMNEISVALDLYKLDAGRFPGGEGLEALLRNPGQGAAWKGPYLKREAILKDPWGRSYLYTPRGEGAGYALTSLGADGKTGGEGDNADITVQAE